MSESLFEGTGSQCNQYNKRCNKCGVVYRPSGWMRLPLLGYQTSIDIDGELRNCPCETTLMKITRMSDYAKELLERKQRT